MTVTVPPGDPAVLHAVAGALRDSGRAGSRGGTTAASHSADLMSAWRGPAGDGVRRGLDVVARHSRDADAALRGVATALDGYAETLAQAQARARALVADLASAEEAFRRSLRRAGEAADTQRQELVSSAHRDLAAARCAVDRAIGGVDEQVAVAAEALRQRVQEAVTGFGPVLGQSPSALQDRVRELLATQLPVLHDHPDLVRSLVWAAGTRAVAAITPASESSKWLRPWLREGWPWDAYPRSGLEYVSDVSRPARELPGLFANEALDQAGGAAGLWGDVGGSAVSKARAVGKLFGL